MSGRSGRIASRVGSKISKYASRGARRAVSRSVSSSAGAAADKVSEQVGGGIMATITEYLKNPLVLIGILAVAALVYYFFVYRPQQDLDKEKTEREEIMRRQMEHQAAMAQNGGAGPPEMTEEQIEMLRRMHYQAEEANRANELRKQINKKSGRDGKKNQQALTEESIDDTADVSDVQRPSDEEIIPQITAARSDEDTEVESGGAS